MFTVGVDLGQSQEYTAISIVERVGGVATSEPEYHLRYLDRPPLGTRYPAIVALVLALLDRPPLSRATPLVIDKTAVGAAVLDLFTAAGVRPRAVTITGGTDESREDPYSLRVPKRELAGTLVALYQGKKMKMAEGLDLAPVLAKELVSFKVKVNLAKDNDNYEAWRESIHDDLVLSVALACWHAKIMGDGLPLGWLRNDPKWVAQVFGQSPGTAVVETDEERIARRMAAAGMVEDVTGTHKYGAPLPNPWLPERHG